MQHAFPKYVIGNERKLIPQIQQRSDNEDEKTDGAIAPKDYRNCCRNEKPSLPRLCPERKRKLVRQSCNRPNESEDRKGAVG
jgi:hypothetical protein